MASAVRGLLGAAWVSVEVCAGVPVSAVCLVPTDNALYAIDVEASFHVTGNSEAQLDAEYLAGLLASGSFRAGPDEARDVDFEGTVACSRPGAGTRVDLVARYDGSVCTCCTARPVGGEFEPETASVPARC